jgi:hypothetical protein
LERVYNEEVELLSDRKEYLKKYRKLNKNKIQDYNKHYKDKNKLNIRIKGRLYYAAHKTEAKLYRKANKLKIKKYKKNYVKINKEKIKLSRHIHYLKNKECVLNCVKKYYKDHKTEKKIYIKNYINTPNGKLIKTMCSNRRRESYNNVLHNYNKEDWNIKKRNTGGYCLKKYGGCGKRVGYKKLTLDHIYPLSRAYEDYLKTGNKRVYTINDVTPICKRCNSHWNNSLKGEIKNENSGCTSSVE